MIFFHSFLEMDFSEGGFAKWVFVKGNAKGGFFEVECGILSVH